MNSSEISLVNNADYNNFRTLLDSVGNRIIRKIQQNKDKFYKFIQMDLVGLVNEVNIPSITDLNNIKFTYQFNHYWFNCYLHFPNIKLTLYGIRGDEFYFRYEFGTKQNDFYQIPRLSRMLHTELDILYNLMILDNNYRYYDDISRKEFLNDLENIEKFYNNITSI